jgi:hypothetical protein
MPYVLKLCSSLTERILIEAMISYQYYKNVINSLDRKDRYLISLY